MSAKKATEDDQPDLEVIVPDEATVTVDGISCRVKRLKTREILMLFRVVTKNFDLTKIKLDRENPEQMQAQVVGVLIAAIPEAIDDFVDLVDAVVVPKSEDAVTAKRVHKALYNPELDVLIDVVDAIAMQEKDDLASLVGKVQALIQKVKVVYVGAGKPDPSPEPSTSSPASTDGQTTKSLT